MKPMTIIALAFVLSQFAHPVFAQSKLDIGAAIAGATGDLASTHYALTNGAHESNTLLGSSVQQIAIRKSLITSGVIAGALFLGKSGHPKIASWLLRSTASVGTFATVHNLRVAR